MFTTLNSGQINANCIQELYYLVAIDNVPSILQHGILSHVRADKLHHKDMSNQQVQDRRENKVIERVKQPPQPHSKPLNLHRFVNLFLNPHNAMILAIYQNQNRDSEEICIVRINKAILNRGDVILTDQNAATNGAQFFTAERFSLSHDQAVCLKHLEAVGFKAVQKLSIFQNKHKEEIAVTRKQIRQAEVLVPYYVEASYITGFFVSCQQAQNKLGGILSQLEKTILPVVVHPSMFFQEEGNSKGALPGTAKADLNIQLQTFCPLDPRNASDSRYPDSSDDEDAHDKGIVPTPLQR